MPALARLGEWLTSALTILRPLKARVVVDQPDVVEAGYVYLVGDDGAPWSAAFLCPCRCGAIIQLSLIANDRPHWRAAIHANGAVTLQPSIWRTTGCRSHFIVRRGRVVWARTANTHRNISAG
jgi:hypothetical protein